jgi:uncharacterized membrane protein YkvA (DUF1232 family)
MKMFFRIGAIRSLAHSGRLSWRVARDPRTPVWLKVMLVGAIVLIASPINWIPNFIPVLGQLEDLALLGLALNLFLKAAPPDIRAEHEAALSFV